MGKMGFYKVWFTKTFSKPLYIVDLVAGILTIVLGVVNYFLPSWGSTMNVLPWAIIFLAVLLVVSILVGFFLAPYYIYKEQADKVREYETQAIELEENVIQESRWAQNGVWVARVGVRALGQKAVRGIFVYLRYIDGNQNGLFDAPLHPAGRLRNVTGAITVCPGNTQQFVEVLHYNPAVPEMGIPYNLNYQLREMGIDIQNSPDSLPDKVDVSSHNLILYAAGEDIKPIEKTFKVEIIDGKLEMHRI